ncbi:hydroxyisourate hydrolase [Henriciella mobilis]|uniref:5-hydroxyisourate hydrolase n=1 Tax=Henriciella mobilis TaxID=2305467 RepID=A0A399RU51_9PROT|nr:hydroxyisourate hydrolase [Henriciella mobilis]RIJ32995.1 hydroxyisourate hydrolase [Henriciella mobilis]
MGLSTHILDLVTGMPAKGVKVSLSIDGEPAGESVTNDDGRCTDLLGARPLKAGVYRLVFHAGDYLGRSDEPPFFDVIPIDFTVTDTERHYHVPLLLSPFGYSTYRGS